MSEHNLGETGAASRRLDAAGQGALVPQWPAPACVGLVTTTREGRFDAGASSPQAAPDDPIARLAFTTRRFTGLLPVEPVWLRQVHGAQVVVLDEAALAAARATPPVADAAVTRLPGVACAVLTADCLPVAITDRRGSAVGVAHAGWRGLAAGVVEAAVSALSDLAVDPGEMIAWLGPAIGPAAFEVGADVLEAFVATDPGAAAFFAPDRPGKWRADLYALARRRLAAAGVPSIHGGGFCTHADAARFHSYRRDRTTGRMATFIWRARDGGVPTL